MRLTKGGHRLVLPCAWRWIGVSFPLPAFKFLCKVWSWEEVGESRDVCETRLQVTRTALENRIRLDVE